MRLAVLAMLPLCACAMDEDLSLRHGSPLYTFACENDKAFQSRQIISGEVEVTAGGMTRDARDADGDDIPGGPRLTHAGDLATLTGMPGGPYERCVMQLE